MMRVRAYFDGFNFYKGASAVADLHRDASGSAPHWKWLDVKALCEVVASRYWGPVDVTYAAYFTAEVKRMFAGDTRHERQSVYLDALRLAGVEIVLGTFTLRPGWRELVAMSKAPLRSEGRVDAKVRLPGEKGSDVNLATWLLRDYYTRRSEFDASIVVSNDYDLWHPVETLRREGWPVGIINPHGEHPKVSLMRAGLGLPCFGHRMTIQDLMAAPMADPVVGRLDAEVIECACPPGWKA